jgi:cell division protein FtsB
MDQEMTEHQVLSSQIDTLTSENVALQDEIHGLKSDSKMIEREARKLGLSRPNEKVLVPTK